jgi:hypothetical protein
MEYLRINYLDLSISDMAAKLGRSENSVRCRACKMRREEKFGPGKKPLSRTPEQIKKCVDGMVRFRKGRPLTDEHKARISAGNKGKRAGKTIGEIFGEDRAARMIRAASKRWSGPENPIHWRTPEQCKAQGQKLKGRMVGSKHPNWKGGESFSYRYLVSSGEWKELRKLVYERDGWICQICGQHCGGRKIQCHHIVPFLISQDNSLDNLITLCVPCHGIEEAAIYRHESLLTRPAYAFGCGLGTAIGLQF